MQIERGAEAQNRLPHFKRHEAKATGVFPCVKTSVEVAPSRKMVEPDLYQRSNVNVPRFQQPPSGVLTGLAVLVLVLQVILFLLVLLVLLPAYGAAEYDRPLPEKSSSGAVGVIGLSSFEDVLVQDGVAGTEPEQNTTGERPGMPPSSFGANACIHCTFRQPL